MTPCIVFHPVQLLRPGSTSAVKAKSASRDGCFGHMNVAAELLNSGNQIYQLLNIVRGS
ncbi:hypothetical protein Vi05172_g1985 [Venturia inaequalis]|nr:hypothetical protein Vi05172_g1985 [Venturia inaequalis]